jgi:hypothetical protein
VEEVALVESNKSEKCHGLIEHGELEEQAEGGGETGGREYLPLREQRHKEGVEGGCV